MLYYFEDSHPKRLDERKRRLAEIESAISTDEWNGERMKEHGSEIVDNRDELRKERIPEIPTWHRSLLYGLLIGIIAVLGGNSLASFAGLVLNVAVTMHIWVWNGVHLVSYSMLMVVAIFAGTTHWRILRRLKACRKEIEEFAGTVKTVRPFL